MESHKAELGIVDYIRPVTGPTAIVATNATVKTEAVRGGRIGISRVIVAPDTDAAGAFVTLYAGMPAVDRLIDAITIPIGSPAAIFDFQLPVVLNEFESLYILATGFGATATNVWVTVWAQLLRPKSAAIVARPDTESVGTSPQPWQGEIDSPPEYDTEDSAIALGRPHRQEVY